MQLLHRNGAGPDTLLDFTSLQGITDGLSLLHDALLIAAPTSDQRTSAAYAMDYIRS